MPNSRRAAGLMLRMTLFPFNRTMPSAMPVVTVSNSLCLLRSSSRCFRIWRCCWDMRFSSGAISSYSWFIKGWSRSSSFSGFTMALDSRNAKNSDRSTATAKTMHTG